MPDLKDGTIRRLNDHFRRTMRGGTIVTTPGIRELPETDRKEIFSKISRLEDFPEAEDSNRHHAFGCVEHEKTKVFFKIDCYDEKMFSASRDPADRSITSRVLTVFLGHEY